MNTPTILIGQSGGPTAVINASLYGLIKEAKLKCPLHHIIGCHHGIDGILYEEFISLDEVKPTLSTTPGMALGSVRKKLPSYQENPALYESVRKVFEKHHITHFFYIGGNDSMDTAARLSDYFTTSSFPCVVIGIPKTIDNDLVGQDHTPGYGSCAKYLATTLQELAYDTAVYAKGRVTIVEVMGRDTGWLAAATGIGTHYSVGPDAIFIPEIPFQLDDFLKRVKKIYQEKKRALIVTSEGIKDIDGNYLSNLGMVDRFDHQQLGGVAQRLALLVETKLQLPTRAIEISLSQRAAGHILSKRDHQEALEVGRKAMRFGLEGLHGMMVTIQRKQNNPYRVHYKPFPLTAVANFIKPFPGEWMNQTSMLPNEEFLHYVLPLIEGEVKIPYSHGIPDYSLVIRP